jgi:hypothetical protein
MGESGVSTKKLSPRDYAQLNRGVRVGVRYPPGGRAELRVPGKGQRRKQRKRNNEGGN